MAISNVTRYAIFDELRKRGTVWHGRLSTVEFLARLRDLDQLPSDDQRYETARQDITTHTINWPGDWEPDWVYSDSRFELMENDEKLLAFLAEMLHPEVRPDAKDARELAALINEQLVHDAYQLVEFRQISGRPVFEPRSIGLPQVAPAIEGTKALESPYVSRQIARMNMAIDTDPALAIGTAKELLETTCATLLRALGVAVPEDVPKLVRATLDVTAINVAGAPGPGRAEQALRRLLGNLAGVGAAVAEVRNACGTGHGQPASTGDLDPVYARLVVSATATIVTFLADRYRALHVSRT